MRAEKTKAARGPSQLLQSPVASRRGYDGGATPPTCSWLRFAAGYGTLTGGTRNWNWGWWFGFCFWFWFFMWHVVFQQPQPPLSCLVY